MDDLRRQAEAEMRRPAPPLADQPQTKKQRLKDGAAAEVERFSYAATEALMQGCTCILATCGFRRERSTVKETLPLLQKQLPSSTKLELIKVGCCGLIVFKISGPEAVDPVSIIEKILGDVESGALKRTKHCQRLLPAQVTCAFKADAVKAAATALCQRYIATHPPAEPAVTGEGGGPLTFAVLYKHRGPDNKAMAAATAPAAAPGAAAGPLSNGGAGEVSTAAAAEGGAEPPPAAAEGVQAGEDTAAAEGPATAAPAAGGGNAGASAAGAAAPGGNQALDRSRTLELLAGAMLDACEGCGGAKVDLKAPQVVMLAEVIPVAQQQLVLALAVVPSSMMNIRPKMNIKVLGGAEAEQQQGKKGKGRR